MRVGLISRSTTSYMAFVRCLHGKGRQLLLVATVFSVFVTWTVHGQTQGTNSNDNGQNNSTQNECKVESDWFIGSQIVLLVLVFVGMPLFSQWQGSTNRNAGGNTRHLPPLKALNLPEGSVRGMIALAIVGSFLNVLAFGGCTLGNQFSSVVTAFGTLAGSVTGFYFGSRTQTPTPQGGSPQSPEPGAKTGDVVE